MGDNVKIAIPYPAIIDVEKSSAMDFSETIEVKVEDNEEPLSVDSYFFAYFKDLSEALDQIREAVRSTRGHPLPSPQVVLDTTASRPVITTASTQIERTQSLPVADLGSKTSSGFRLTSLLRPFQENLRSLSSLASDHTVRTEDFTHVSKRNGASFVPITSSSPRTQEAQLPSSIEGSASSLTPTPSTMDHTYPPSSPINESPSTGAWSVGVPAWLKGPSRRVLGGSSSSTCSYSTPLAASTSVGGISEVYSSSTFASSSSASPSGIGSSDMGYSVLETPETTIDQETTEKFRTAFAFDDKEALLGCTSEVTGLCIHPYVIIRNWPDILCRLFGLYIQSLTHLWPTLHLYQLFLFQVQWTPNCKNEGVSGLSFSSCLF